MPLTEMTTPGQGGSGGGSALFATGTVDLDSSQNTPIQTVDVNSGVAFEPKTITYDTMNGSYRQNVFWDADLAIYSGSHRQLVYFPTNDSVTKVAVGDTTGARIISVDADGFTVGKAGSTYGTKCNYKAYG